MLLAVPAGLAIGAIIGTIGGGGAILALPVLVYLLDQPVGAASTGSLIVVCLAAASGVAGSRRHAEVCWRVAWPFSAAAAGGALVGALINTAVSARTLMLAFAPVMLAAATAMWRTLPPDAGAQPACPTWSWRVGAAGTSVGCLTGFFGVGGGFLIVPILVHWIGVPAGRTVGTSLVIIFLTGIAALASHLLTGALPDLSVIALLGAATVVGAVLASRVAGKLSVRQGARAFALVVGSVALALLVDVLLLGGPHAG